MTGVGVGAPWRKSVDDPPGADSLLPVILYVDIEHAKGYARERGDVLRAARTRITYNLEDVVQDDVHLIRYDRVDAAAVERLGARAIFISGNSGDPADYGDELTPFLEVLASAALPTFGFCGGHQMIARAHGVDLELVGTYVDADTGETKRTFEFGYEPVHVEPHPLFDGVGSAPIVRHAHSWLVPHTPEGFEVLGRTELTPIQVMVDDDRRQVGTQFHPEWWTDEHPAGRTMIENFVSWAGLG